jgi:two-component system CheB/CheR fusion protein
VDQERTRDKPSDVRVVGIGSSAGGIEAITNLLDFLPDNTGMAFVFIQHLSPSSNSTLLTILEKHTKMPASQVEKSTLVKPNHIYVIYPGTVLILTGQILMPFPITMENQIGSTINAFFTSLATVQNERAIGVILSGANTDGTEGIKAIKAADGMVYAQTSESAKFATMPNSAIAVSNIDYIIPPDEIGRQLGQFGATDEAVEIIPNEVECWTELLDLLKKSSGIDFKSYKGLTVTRRVLRRIGLTKNATLQDYLYFIKKQPAELRNLERELLINYTKFFRDEKVFETIKTEIFPELFRNRLPSDIIRLWIPGCSTGEEAYSFAIILSEFMKSHDLTNPVQIFGSDADDEAVEQARLGIYPKTIREEVSLMRLRKFFIEMDKGYKLTNEIRSKCVFSKQNVASDPPFSRVDLISCRNLLIYFGSSLQKQALLRFHYALKPNGLLVLGTSESTNNMSDYFESVTKRNKIYRKKSLGSNTIVNLFEPSTFISMVNTNQSGGGAMQKQSRLESAVEKEVLDRYGPVGVVVDDNMEVVQLRGQTSEFLSLASGKPSLNLLKIIREDLSLDLFHALQQAKATKGLVKTPRIPINKGNGMVSIEVIPICDDIAAESYLLILFEKIDVPIRETVVTGQDVQIPLDWYKQQEELAATREYMKSVIVQYESNNEKLRTANEEAQTSNEELQTMNEELETAKEELQSTNEELITLNEELQSRNDDLRNVNSDIQNVLRSIGTGILMLDGALRIRRFNPGTERLFNLIQTDLGRPISNLRYNLRLSNFEEKIKKAIDDLSVIEEEVVTNDGEWYLMQIRPYRTIDNRIDGAVILFTNITSMRKSLDASKEALVLAEGIVATMLDPLVILQSADLRIKLANNSFYRTFKILATETLNKCIYDLDDGLWKSPTLRGLLEDVATKKMEVQGIKLEWESSDLGQRKMLVNVHRIIDEATQGYLVLMVVRDITPDK